MIASVGSTSCGTTPRASMADASSKAKAASLEQQIDTKSMQQARTTCNQTAGQIGRDIAGLMAQLAQLQLTDKGGGSDVSSPTADSRYQEF